MNTNHLIHQFLLVHFCIENYDFSFAPSSDLNICLETGQSSEKSWNGKNKQIDNSNKFFIK